MTDGAAHFLAGLGTAAFVFPVADRFGFSPFLSAALASVAVGAAKEGLDALGFGAPQATDFFATVLGGLVGLGVSWVVSFA